jgi:hypothetical protein
MAAGCTGFRRRTWLRKLLNARASLRRLALTGCGIVTLPTLSTGGRRFTYCLKLWVMLQLPQLASICTRNPTIPAVCIWQLSGCSGLGGSCGLLPTCSSTCRQRTEYRPLFLVCFRTLCNKLHLLWLVVDSGMT